MRIRMPMYWLQDTGFLGGGVGEEAWRNRGERDGAKGSSARPLCFIHLCHRDNSRERTIWGTKREQSEGKKSKMLSSFKHYGENR